MQETTPHATRAQETGAALTVRHQGWAEPARPAAMSAAQDADPRLTVTSHGILRDGVGWVPVSGEIHYSRVPRARWRESARRTTTTRAPRATTSPHVRGGRDAVAQCAYASVRNIFSSSSTVRREGVSVLVSSVVPASSSLMH